MPHYTLKSLKPMRKIRTLVMGAMGMMAVLFSGQVQSSMCCVSCAMRKEDEVEMLQEVDRLRKLLEKEE